MLGWSGVKANKTGQKRTTFEVREKKFFLDCLVNK